MSANAQAMCTSFKQDVLNGVHAFSAAYRAADTFKGALYSVNESIGAATTAYSATGEASGTGYTAGGMTVPFATAPATSGTVAILTPSAALTWTGLTLAAFDTLLLYNSSATGKNSVAAFNFGSQSVTTGTFTLNMPANAAGTALIQEN